MLPIKNIRLFTLLILTSPSISLEIHKTYSNSFGVPFANATYDYVVVGGGNAGLAIAARLAEDPSLTVAVIEAGGFYQIDNGNGSVVPGLTGSQRVGTSLDINHPLIDWDFVTTPQQGANNRRIRYARGKTMGGSTARNFMAYQRPTIESMDKWASLLNDDSYKFEEMLPYYEKSTQFSPPATRKGVKNGTITADLTAWNNSLGGPVYVAYPSWDDPYSTYLEKGFEGAGFKYRKDGFNSGGILGYGWATKTVNPEDGHRSSSQAYLDDAITSTGLQIYTNTLAKKILFTSDKKTSGVLVSTGGILYTLAAKKEVIISAGAYQSPQLLMVSGIGPRETLQANGIEVISDLPGVGHNMWDHAIISVANRVSVTSVSTFFSNPDFFFQANADFQNNASGPLTSPFGNWGWEKAPEAYVSEATRKDLDKEFTKDWPSLEYIAVPAYFGPYTDLADPMDGYNYVSLLIAVITPMSRGNITISSADTADPPVINPNWLSHPHDVEILLAGFKRAREIIRPHLNEILIGDEAWPGANITTDEQIVQMIHETVAPIYHPSSTCSMGKDGERMAVIDKSAHVFGVTGLRVVDASSLPFLPPGHPMSTIYALAEKIAAEILAGH